MVCAHNNFRLSHLGFQLLAKQPPPGAIQPTCHNFDDNDVVALLPVGIDPRALGWRVGKRR